MGKVVSLKTELGSVKLRTAAVIATVLLAWDGFGLFGWHCGHEMYLILPSSDLCLYIRPLSVPQHSYTAYRLHLSQTLALSIGQYREHLIVKLWPVLHAVLYSISDRTPEVARLMSSSAHFDMEVRSLQTRVRCRLHINTNKHLAAVPSLQLISRAWRRQD